MYMSLDMINLEQRIEQVYYLLGQQLLVMGRWYRVVFVWRGYQLNRSGVMDFYSAKSNRTSSIPGHLDGRFFWFFFARLWRSHRYLFRATVCIFILRSSSWWKSFLNPLNPWRISHTSQLLFLPLLLQSLQNELATFSCYHLTNQNLLRY